MRIETQHASPAQTAAIDLNRFNSAPGGGLAITIDGEALQLEMAHAFPLTVAIHLRSMQPSEPKPGFTHVLSVDLKVEDVQNLVAAVKRGDSFFCCQSQDGELLQWHGHARQRQTACALDSHPEPG